MIKRSLIAAISFYKRRISPYLPQACRYHPSCSTYALQAIERHGAVKGLLLGMWRILRCNPVSHGGYDPVPPKGCWSCRPRFYELSIKAAQQRPKS